MVSSWRQRPHGPHGILDNLNLKLLRNRALTTLLATLADKLQPGVFSGLGLQRGTFPTIEMGACFTKVAVHDELEVQLPAGNKKGIWKKAPIKKAPATKQCAAVATIPCLSSSEGSDKVAARYNTTRATAGTIKSNSSKIAPAQEASSLVSFEEEPAGAPKTTVDSVTVQEAVEGQVLDISPGSLHKEPAPPELKPTIREAQCQELIDDLLSQLAVVEDRKQRLKAEMEHASAMEEGGIARQLNAGKKTKARLLRALEKARAELALARIDTLPELPSEDYTELSTLGKGNWGEVVGVACYNSVGELQTFALKKALVPAGAAAAQDATPGGGQAAADAAAEPAAHAAGPFCGASAKAAPVESGALDLPGAGRCSGTKADRGALEEEEASSEAAEEAAEEVDLAGVEEVELLDTREISHTLSGLPDNVLMNQLVLQRLPGTLPHSAVHMMQDGRSTRRAPFFCAIGPHSGIIGCIGWVGRDRSALLLELAPFGTLDSCLWGKQQRGRMRWTAAEKLRISLQWVRAAMHIHAAGAVHRDIKPQNALMVARTDARLADFGMACWASDASRCRGLAGSVGYSINPLSVEDFSAAGVQDDTWAIGMLIWCMHTRRDISSITGRQMVALERCPAKKDDEQRVLERCRNLGLPEGHYCYEVLVAQTLGLAGLDAPGIEDNPLTKPQPGEPKMPEEFTHMLRRATSVNAWREQPVSLQEWEECLVSCLREAEEAEEKARMGCSIRWRF
ncbi:probable calcium/calmodulin-dependent protein kinase I at C-terminar half [Coccomyxa sp. Obi]|nr:probable calcium/calmodulin-dependent protein kinase I at C-terminar half [Coccomyxa sp. Obi]